MLTELRALIVEDEPLAQQRLAKLLKRMPAVQIVGVADQGRDALAMIESARPNLLLLDIEMPGINGFDLLEKMTGDVQPAVIFVTAFDNYALNAFAVRAADYVLKPIEEERLEAALDQARRDISSRNVEKKLVELRQLTAELRRQTVQRSSYEQELWVQHRSQLVRVSVTAIDWIEAQKDYVRIHSGEQSYFVRGSIGSIEERLDPADFMRVHRSAIVRLDCVTSVGRSRYGALDIELSAGTTIRVGRNYSATVRRWIAERSRSG